MKKFVSFEKVVLEALAVLLSDACHWQDIEPKEIREPRQKYIESTLNVINEYLKEI